MREDIFPPTQTRSTFSPTIRELLAMAFRHRRLAVQSFLSILLGALIVAPMLPKYQANLKILVRNERLDPVIASGQEPQQNTPSVTEEQLNSEAELLKSEDLLRTVVLTPGLFHPATVRPSNDPRQLKSIDSEVRRLQRSLIVALIPKTHLIELTYQSSNPQQAADVLNTVAKLYLDKHLEVHRSPGQYQFFEQQAEHYRKEMEAAESELVASKSVAPHLVRDMTLQKLSDFNASLEQTRAAIRETQQRIGVLKQQQATVPSRLTTQVRRADNQQLLQQLKSTLLNLELKRAELLSKYQPTYQPVREVEQQIADTRVALQAEENSPAREEVTDQNPTHAWIRSELTKAQADLIGLEAREAASERTVAAYDSKATRLEQSRIVEQDLERTAKMAEENYLLYRRKGEESRISDALDEQRILNVTVAQGASVPSLPAHSMSYYALLGLVLACFVTAGLVLAADYLDASYRTPEEVMRSLDLPVLAALPKPCHSYILHGRDGPGRSPSPAAVEGAGILDALPGDEGRGGTVDPGRNEEGANCGGADNACPTRS